MAHSGICSMNFGLQRDGVLLIVLVACMDDASLRIIV